MSFTQHAQKYSTFASFILKFGFCVKTSTPNFSTGLKAQTFELTLIDQRSIVMCG